VRYWKLLLVAPLILYLVLRRVQFKDPYAWALEGDDMVGDIVNCVAVSNSSSDDSPPRIAVVVPMIPKEWPEAISLVKSMDDFLPCTLDRSSILVFFLSRSWDSNQEVIEARRAIQAAFSELRADVRSCFAEKSPVFADAALTKAQDQYRSQNRGDSMDGPNYMFYNLFTSWAIRLQSVSHVAYIETDAKFIRRYWLDALYGLVSDTTNFWMDGSLPYPKELVFPPKSAGIDETFISVDQDKAYEHRLPGSHIMSKKQYLEEREQAWIELKRTHSRWIKGSRSWVDPAISNHKMCGPFSINGNALYNVRDPCFAALVAKLKYYTFHQGYDHNLFLYRCHPDHSELTYVVHGKFRTSSLFLDMGHREWSLRYILTKYPQVFIATQAENQVP